MRSSQLHKLSTHGKNSAGEYAPSMRSLTQHGTDVIVAVIEVRGFGNVGDVLNATTDIGAGPIAHAYTVLAAAETCDVMATGLAADITLEVDHTAVAVGCNVHVTKSTAGTVEIVSSSVS